MHYCCLCTAYNIHMYMHVGGIRMLRNEEKQWELQVDHSLFAIKKLDITVSIIYAEFSIITGASCVHGGGANTGISRPDLIMASGLGGRERVDQII